MEATRKRRLYEDDDDSAAVKSVKRRRILAPKKSVNRNLDEFKRKLADFETLVDECSDVVRNHCQYLKDEIEVAIESVILELHSHRDVLFKRIHEFENECLNKIDENKREATVSINQIKKWFENYEKQATSYSTMILYLTGRIESFRKEIFQYKSLNYVQNQDKVEANLIGYLEEKCVRKEKKFDFAAFISTPQMKPLHEIVISDNVSSDYTHSYFTTFGYDCFSSAVNSPEGIQLKIYDQFGAVLAAQTNNSKEMHVRYLFANSTNVYTVIRNESTSSEFLCKYDNYLCLCRKTNVASYEGYCCTDNNIYALSAHQIEIPRHHRRMIFSMVQVGVTEFDCVTFSAKSIHSSDHNNCDKYEFSIHSQDSTVYLIHRNEIKLLSGNTKKHASNSIFMEYFENPCDIFFIEDGLIFSKYNTLYFENKEKTTLKEKKIGTVGNGNFYVTKNGNLALVNRMESKIEIF